MVLILALKAHPTRTFDKKRFIRCLTHRRPHWAAAIDNIRPILWPICAGRKFFTNNGFDFMKRKLKFAKDLLSAVFR